MRPTHHLIISAGFGAAYGAAMNSWSGAAAVVISGVLIDLDHHIEYYIAHKKIPWSYKELKRFCAAHQEWNKIYLIFHSYELLVILWLSAYIFQWNTFWTGIVVGMTQHMICDEFYNPIRPLGYFWWYRIKHGFAREKIIKHPHE